MKTCSICTESKPFSEFGRLTRSRDGLAGRCKPCARIAVAATKAKPPQARKKRPLVAKTQAERSRDYIARHPEKFARKTARRVGVSMPTVERSRKWVALNPEKSRAKTARWRERNPNANRDYHKRNPHVAINKAAERRARKLNATPGWRDPFFIAEIYDLARRRSRVTGIAWEVDHAVPLKSDVVCGLHCEHNLQVIPRAINKLKGNKHA